jgi:hypothetical protein
MKKDSITQKKVSSLKNMGFHLSKKITGKSENGFFFEG